MKEKITVIVPLYNAEAYVKQCIEGLLAQTYKEFRVILINDGSTDDTGNLCRKYTLLDERFCYIEQENGGTGKARNIGIENTETPFMLFLDCDDRLPQNAIEIYMGVLDEADLVVGGIEKTEGKQTKEFMPHQKKIKGKKMIAQSLLEEMYFINPVCSKLYKTKIIKNNDICFNDFKYGEDTDFIYTYLKYADTILFLNKIVYCVNATEGSLSLSPVPEIWTYMKKLYEKGKQFDQNNKQFCYMLFLRSVKTSLLIKTRETKDDFYNVCTLIVDYIVAENIEVIFEGGIYDKLVIMCVLNKHWFILYEILKVRTIIGI